MPGREGKKEERLQFREIMAEVGREMLQKYTTLASHIPHLQQRGEGRENILREFLDSYLPGRFGVDTGFVFSSEGQVSSQMDIIIYDRAFAPNLRIAGKALFPLECVVAVGEVKTSIEKIETIQSAIENLASVKLMEKKGAARLGGGFLAGTFDSRSDELAQIMGFIFASSLMSEDSMFQALSEYCLMHLSERHLWPDLIGSLQDGVYHYFRWKDARGGGSTDSHPNKANGIYHKRPSSPELSLLSFYLLLYNNIIGKKTGFADLVDYLEERGRHDSLFARVEFPIGS
jgi:hypothetical protein